MHTLKIKETDRLVALLNELEKLGANVEITNKSIHLKPSNFIEKNCIIKTYNDHRMAMAFAPLALKVPITIEDADVVTKSYPSFWEDFTKITGANSQNYKVLFAKHLTTPIPMLYICTHLIKKR